MKSINISKLIFVLSLVLTFVVPVLAESIELYYDDGTEEGGGEYPNGRVLGVLFSLPDGVSEASVTSVRFYAATQSPYGGFGGGATSAYATIYDPYSVDLARSSPVSIVNSQYEWILIQFDEPVLVTDDFYVGITSDPFSSWLGPYIARDSSTSGNSYYNLGGTVWTPVSYGNHMIRASIEYEALPSDIEVGVDVDPDTLNLKSRGKWVTAYLSAPEGYSVEDYEISSLTLDGVSAAKSSIEDGVLKVKFARNDLDLEPGDSVQLDIAGSLLDGTGIYGSDSIRVISKGK